MSCFLFFFFFLFLAVPTAYGSSPGQGLNPSCSCSSAGSLNPLLQSRGSNPCLCSNLSCCSQILNLLPPSGISLHVFLKQALPALLSSLCVILGQLEPAPAQVVGTWPRPGQAAPPASLATIR